MKSIDKEINIIWLSDIHFQNSYLEKDEHVSLNRFIDSFHEHIVELKIQNKTEFDYILISGDIAQSGELSEYELFKKRILNKLQENSPNSKLLIVPGNHDVNRAQAESLNEFIYDYYSSNRFEFLKNNVTKFEKIFGNYSLAFKDNNALPDNDYSSLKDNNLLYGYVLNREKKSLILLLNSAWYSIGEGFLKHYLEEKVFKISFREEKEELKIFFRENVKNIENFNLFLTNFLTNYLTDKRYIVKPRKLNRAIENIASELNMSKVDFEENDKLASKAELFSDKVLDFRKELISKEIEEISNEYGKQILALDIFDKELDKIKELEKKYNDFIITSIMHHPINWLDWNERIPTPSGMGFSFHYIKSISDLLLTGHEHVPEIHRTEMINSNELLHIQAGCFMNAQDPITFKTKNNWFSTLCINTNKRTVKQIKHLYNEGDENKPWSKGQVDNPHKLNKKHSTILSAERNLDIQNREFNIRNFLKLSSSVEISKNGYYLKGKCVYKYIEEPLTDSFNLTFKELKDVIKSKECSKVCFIFTDYSHPLYEQYLSDQKEKLSILHEIKNDFDLKFDIFRHDFFSSLEECEVEKYKQLKFRSVVKPYWVTETFLSE